MPIIKSAKKKVKQDKKRGAVNTKHAAAYKKALTKLKRSSASKASEIISKIDKAVKHGVIHKKKAARLKSKASKLFKAKKKASK